MQARFTRELGVSRSTVCRDMAWLHRWLNSAHDPKCRLRELLAELWSREGAAEHERDGVW